MYSIVSDQEVLNTSQGSVRGVLSVVIFPRTSVMGAYVLNRKSYKCYGYLPELYANRDVFVNTMRCVTTDVGSRNRAPLFTVFDLCDDCTEECTWMFVSNGGETQSYCSCDHAISVGYSSSIMHVPMGFNQFSQVPWCDEFLSDSPDVQDLAMPEEFDGAYDDEIDIIM